MKKGKLLTALLFVLVIVLFCGCGVDDGVASGPADPADGKLEAGASSRPAGGDEPEFVSQTDEDGWYTVMIRGEVFWTDGMRVREPENSVDIEAADLADFGEHFSTQYPVTADYYKLCENTDYEIEVCHISSAEPGPVVYIVSGVHGDEIGAWYAGRLLREMTISKGDVYLIAPANTNGAKNGTRYVTGQQDLNRSFPGGSSDAGKIAGEIFGDIGEKQPDLLLDLHEAIVYSGDRDFLGSTLIFTDLAGIEDLFFDVLLATQTGEICQGEFGYTGPGPKGSINATVTNELHIPAITVETFRGYSIGRRISEQLDIVQYILTYMGMEQQDCSAAEAVEG